jgi:hypothetical protein
MHALSIMQPWAFLIVNGHKTIENRNWETSRRGPVFIHASRSFAHDAYDRMTAGQHPAQPGLLLPTMVIPKLEDMKTGGIVGVAELVDCVDNADDDWFVGKFGLVFKDARPLPFTPLRGQLGFFPVPADICQMLGVSEK